MSWQNDQKTNTGQKIKSGKDYLSLDECVVLVNPDISVRIPTISETVSMTEDEFKQIIDKLPKRKPND